MLGICALTHLHNKIIRLVHNDIVIKVELLNPLQEGYGKVLELIWQMSLESLCCVVGVN